MGIAGIIISICTRTTPKRLLLCLLGLVLMVLLKSYFRPVMTKAFGSHWGKLFFSIIYTFYYIALFPVVLKIYDRKSEGIRRLRGGAGGVS